jgi:ADP-ribosylglycohydrolase
MVWHDSGRLGAVTDDTQMTLFTMDGLIRSHGTDVPAAVYAAHRRWYATQLLPGSPKKPGPQKLPTWGSVTLDGWLAAEQWLYARRAPGNACMSGLRSGTRATRGQPANPNSKGCGALMRSAPFGLIQAWSPEQAFEVAVECAVHTHGHPTGYLAAGAFAAIIRRLADGLNLDEAIFWTLETIAGYPGGQETGHALTQATEAARHGKPSPERIEQFGAGFTADEALAIST